MLKQILTLIPMLLITACASPNIIYTPPHTVVELRDQFVQFNRISTITHNIFLANTSVCPKVRNDYGFTFMSITGKGEGEALWVKAFNLQKKPTVTYVIPRGTADRSGLRIGDVIISVNSSYWSDAESQDAFPKQLHGIMVLTSPNMRLGILRDDKKQTLNLTADKTCDYSFILSDTNEHGASARNRDIIIELGAAKLFKHDGELAFFISHELAHILLGHTLPEREKELDDYKMRSIMEKDADALGIRLMVRAGYDPKEAETALKNVDLIDSGPITKLLNYHGPYMSTNERILFLRKVLNQ